jgi:hypothetical protein
MGTAHGVDREAWRRMEKAWPGKKKELEAIADAMVR